MKDAKLNNLLGMEQYSEAEFTKKAKTTKRTGVAKDVLQENAYVVGKEVFKGNPKVEMPTGKGTTVKETGKDVLGDHLKNKETHAAKGLNNLISLDDFSKSVPDTKDHPTKRTGTAKDVLQEKVKVKKEYDDDDDDDYVSVKEKGNKIKKMKDGDKDAKKGLTKAQKKLPEAFQKAILKKQGKK